jgi:hypothetical protein
MRNVAIFLLSFLLVQTACAGELFGTVDAVSGEAIVTDAAGENQRITSGLKIFAGQSIQTAADGEVQIVTEDSGLIALRPNSSFRVDRYQAKGETSDEMVFSLFKGALRSITGWIAKRNTSAYQLNTPTATIGVRGTDHETTVIEGATENDQPGTFDTVNEGITVLRTKRGEIEVHSGEYAFSPRDLSVAPRLLAQRPGFLKRRALRIENRIQRRKENLMQRIQYRLNKKTEIKKHRDAAKKRIKRKLRERREP